MSSGRIRDDWIDSYMEFDYDSEPPDNFKRWVAISTIASALQRKVRIRWGPMTWYPNMYIILVGPPGKAKKGTAMFPGRSFVEDLEVPLCAESITREALVRNMAEISDTIIDPETGVSSFHSSLTVSSPELVVFLGQQNYQLMSDLTDWFDCANSWQYRTKNMGHDKILGVWLNLIGATTPDLIRTALPLDAIGGGLTSRMIFVFEPDRGKICPVPGYSDKQRTMRAELMQDLERIHQLQGDFKVSPAFIDPWTEWYINQANNPRFTDKRFAGYVERRPLHIMKLCMILSASRSNSLTIEPQDLERALQYLADVEVKMPMAFSGVGKEKDTDVVTAIMQEIALRKAVPYKELLGQFMHDVDSYKFEQIIYTLTTINYITFTRGTTNIGDSLIKYKGESSSSMNEALRGGDE